MTIIYLALAAALEVSGDFLMRVGLGGRRWGLVAGACASPLTASSSAAAPSVG
jgi:hypothetical protein